MSWIWLVKTNRYCPTHSPLCPTQYTKRPNTVVIEKKTIELFPYMILNTGPHPLPTYINEYRLTTLCHVMTPMVVIEKHHITVRPIKKSMHPRPE
jgi:hypothetical protein